MLADMTLQVAWMEEGGNVRSRFRTGSRNLCSGGRDEQVQKPVAV